MGQTSWAWSTVPFKKYCVYFQCSSNYPIISGATATRRTATFPPPRTTAGWTATARAWAAAPSSSTDARRPRERRSTSAAPHIVSNSKFLAVVALRGHSGQPNSISVRFWPKITTKHSANTVSVLISYFGRNWSILAEIYLFRPKCLVSAKISGFPMSMLMTIISNSNFWNKKVACSTMLKHQDYSMKSYPSSHTINTIGLITASGASE